MTRRAIREDRRLRFGAFLGLVVYVAMASGCSTTPAEHQDQKAFTKPESAVRALAAAAEAGDTDELLAIFGPEGREILSSGDPVADRRGREVIVVALEQQWTLEKLDRRSRELIIGHEQWPFPIPLVKERQGWRFDTAAGKQEVVARRIGRNELAVINICRTYVIAQREYASQGRDGRPAGIYARKVRSEPGKHDGLYWAVSSPGEAPSPLSELAASAAAEGYATAAPAEPKPFHGYFFRILTRQGDHAPGGARGYIVNGEMTDGFALIAYPAEYGNSGIMTLIVSHDGILHERDLGEQTLKAAGEIQAYNPDGNWRKVE